MNSECSIWRVLIFGVNFAPGYPERYPVQLVVRDHYRTFADANFAIGILLKQHLACFQMNNRILLWLPTWLCATLTIIWAISDIVISLNGSNSGGNVGASVGLALMTACFFNVGLYFSKLDREINELRQQIETINSRNSD